MLNTFWAVVYEGRIETVGEVDAPEGTRALVTLLVEDEADFWQRQVPRLLMTFGTTRRTMFMPSYSEPEIVLVRYPFSDLSSLVVNTN